jgi:hypothetical protein
MTDRLRVLAAALACAGLALVAPAGASDVPATPPVLPAARFT